MEGNVWCNLHSRAPHGLTLKLISKWDHVLASLSLLPSFPFSWGSPFINYVCEHPCLRLYSSKPNRRPMTSAKPVNDKAMKLAWFTSGSATQVGVESLSAVIYTTVERKHQPKLPWRRKKRKTRLLVRQLIQQRHSSKENPWGKRGSNPSTPGLHTVLL